MNEKGFTLIELIVIIVILGILAVTAVPRYVDMVTEAEDAAADGVFGAVSGAITLNFASVLLDKHLDVPPTTPAYDGATCTTGIINHATGNGTCILNALEEIPSGWATDTNANCLAAWATATDGCIFKDTDATAGLSAGDYIIGITTDESIGPPAVKAIVAKSW